MKLIFIEKFKDNKNKYISGLCECTAASYIGLKKELLPPYLDPNLNIEELMTGVSFASAGSGFDPLTPSITVCHASLIIHILFVLIIMCVIYNACVS